MAVAIDKLSHARIFVSAAAWPAVPGFYAGLLGLPVRHIDELAGAAVFDCGEVTLIVERVAEGDADDLAMVGRFTGLSFAVRDVDTVYAELSAAHVAFEGPPKRTAWGGTMVHVRDPAGNVLTLADDPSHR